MACRRGTWLARRQIVSSYISSVTRAWQEAGLEYSSGSGANLLQQSRYPMQQGFPSPSDLHGSTSLTDSLSSRFTPKPTSAAFRNEVVCTPFSRAYASDLPAHQEIGMPSLSPTMTQGNIVEWKIKKGDHVAAGDVLCVIETDKASLEMESMEEGYLAKIIVGDGGKDIQVGQAICIMVENKEDILLFSEDMVGADDAPQTPPPKQVALPFPESAPALQYPGLASPKLSSPQRSPEGRIFASPAAKKLASYKNVPLSRIRGTGPEGHILKADIEDHLASRPFPAKQQSAPALGAGVEVFPAGKAESPLGEVLGYSDIPNNQIRRVTAHRLLQSKQTIPHYYLSLDTRVDKLLLLREQLNQLQAVALGKKLSLNDFVIKAAGLATRKIPECNSSWTDDFIRQYHNVNISVPVQTKHGLMVPVVQDADRKGLSSISEDVNRLADKAKANDLQPFDYEGGTFTVTNLGGPFGIKQFCAVINPPQSCILAVGTMEKRVIPGFEAGQYLPGTFMTVTLTCDHRVVDGAIGAQWLGAFKGYMEDPMTLLL